jgi:hypothetical protein
VGEQKKKDVRVNELDIAHKESPKSIDPCPDIANAPSAPNQVPIPYPKSNIASESAKGSKTIKTEGKKIATKEASFEGSKGDEPGTSSALEDLRGINILKTIKKSSSEALSRIDGVVDAEEILRILKRKFYGVLLWIWGAATILLLLIAISGPVRSPMFLDEPM